MHVHPARIRPPRFASSLLDCQSHLQRQHANNLKWRYCQVPFKLKNTGRNNTAKNAGKENDLNLEKCFIDALADAVQSQFASMKRLLPQSTHTSILRWQLSSAEGGLQVLTFLSTQSTSVYGSLKRNCCRD